MNVYEIVTERIIAALDEGTIPWRRPWRSVGGMQSNLRSKKAYRGINQMLLGLAGYKSPYWLSFKQAKEMGGSVRKGEKSTLVVFWKRLKVEDRDEYGRTEEKTIPLLRYYRVFNVEQCDGLTIPADDTDDREHSPVDSAECIISGMQNAPTLVHGGDSAHYAPLIDMVTLPEPSAFDCASTYYSTSFHEHIHSTGHDSRVGRKIENGFGSGDYAREELVAEIGAAMLCAISGVEDTRTIDNNTAYIQNWRRVLSADPKLIVQAAGQSQRAVDYILGTTFEDSDNADREREIVNA